MMNNQIFFFNSVKKIKYSGSDSFSAHDYFMNNPSLSGRGKAKLKMQPKKLNLRLIKSGN